ncbi:TPA: diguanylate cyclase [Legionella pneumophila subsp. pneumophila]|uniref:diguanylate cyclase n=1 Tax=Legionella pneumophila TaxID=446 RepID=UPI000875D885|nr:diguanylate cyclase [Legionella pneumophila]AOW53035.1 diguanylate cyclase [Legionella pneumophila subsp. pneumophila]AOW56065.1 diguanylate cyclase [Legionella pneumophila subsp. pneumophila]AOW58343.1 diguanylate cyclase [Legionella pneumophila subsp. pneumophila]AOW61475.1 diguanylate cyclase [Legionella pneumophila subsp. pneumophila]AOW63835.1 diguanylate cyclase [Legionella pneumophila subsp. pneumophila]
MNSTWHQTAAGNRSILSNLRLSRTLLNVIFIIALSLLLIINIISYNQVKNLIFASNWVSHSNEVIQTIDTCLYDVVEIESRQRFYLIRGSSPQFMTDVDDMKSTLQLNLDKLEQLTKDNPEQNKRTHRFIDLVKQRLNLLNQLVQLKGSGKLDTQEGYDLLNQSQDMSHQVKSLGQEIKSIELVLLSERNTGAVRWADTSSFILISGGITSILFLTIAFILANIELSTRRKTELQNQNTQIRLKKIIESASDMIAAFDKDQRFITFNEAYQREFKRLFDKSISINMSLEEAFDDVPENKKKLVQTWKESLQRDEETKNIEVNTEQEKTIYEMTSKLIQNGDNEIKGVVHSVRNITKRVQEHTELQESYEKLANGMKELQEKNEQITLLVEMSDIMLACGSQEELSDVMAKYSQRLLQFSSGYLFIMHPSKNYLEKAASWGNPQPHDLTFTPEQCWAIRLGRIHYAGSSRIELMCSHTMFAEQPELSLLCVPLMAQNDIYGLLYLEVGLKFDENQQLLITAFAELTALALANVRLRENLRYQSIRDPLTGLYNRRYLEDFLFKQLHQAERTKASFAILMLDLDHFKKINDTFGHDAGDLVLKELGQILNSDIRLGDIAARYGGEEFVLLLYDIDAQAAKMKAENLRSAISNLQVKYGAQPVGQITASIGISVYPDDAKSPAEVIEAADKALYQAKNKGRNKVILFSEISS